MIVAQQFGYFRGRMLSQERGTVGGYRSVFVKLQEIKNDLVYPTFGGVIRNPFKGPAKFFAGDLMEFKTNDKGVKPDIYILKTFEVLSNSTTTVNIIKDNGFRHKPFVGDVVMVAPDAIGGAGTGVKITAVTETSVTVDTVSYPVWQVTTSSSLGTLAKGTILVEADGIGASTMLVKNINSVADCDGDFFGVPSITENKNVTPFGPESTDYDSPRYFYTPALGGLMYTHKMSPMPDCVKKLNRSNVNGWFRVDYYDMDGGNSAAENALLYQYGTSAPSTSTVGIVGKSIFFVTSGANMGVYICTAESEGSYTWTLIANKNA